MGTGITESLYHSKNVSDQAKYAYRKGVGLIPSSEYAVYFNDFFENPSSNAIPGTTAVIDTGATATAANAAAIGYNGAIDITSDGTTEGVAMYWPLNVQLGNDKKFVMEVRVYTEDADDTDVQFGLSALTATTNPEDLWTTTATDLIAFGVLDGDATPTMLCDKDNSGSSAETASGTDYDLSDATWHTLAIEVGGSATDSSMYVKGYVDGKLAVTWSTETTIPDDLPLAPFIGARTGGDAAHNVYYDYVRWAVSRS